MCVLLHQVQRTNQLHALKVLAVELRHHRLDLAAIEHSHQNGLNYIVEVMTESDLVAAQLFRM